MVIQVTTVVPRPDGTTVSVTHNIADGTDGAAAYTAALALVEADEDSESVSSQLNTQSRPLRAGFVSLLVTEAFKDVTFDVPMPGTDYVVLAMPLLSVPIALAIGYSNRTTTGFRLTLAAAGFVGLIGWVAVAIGPVTAAP